MIVTPDDYILGTSDLTGELMRYATNCRSIPFRILYQLLTFLALSTGDHEVPIAVCDFVRSVKTRKLPFLLPTLLTPALPLPLQCHLRFERTGFDGISPHMLFKLSKKQEETTRSLEKIEKGQLPIAYACRADVGAVCYALRLRLLEYADRPEILRQMAKRALEDVRDGEGGGKLSCEV